jgi:hypothetical protein
VTVEELIVLLHLFPLGAQVVVTFDVNDHDTLWEVFTFEERDGGATVAVVVR